jgi:predicted O-methyltransferase YrrM
VSTVQPTFDQAWSAVADVDGWMTEAQGRTLFEAARACPADGRIVEIGSYRGRSTIVLALGAPVGVEIVAIDPHAGNDRGPQELEGYATEADDDHRRFLANLAGAGVADRVRHVREFSDRAVAMVAGDIDVLYVDGAHRFGPARADISLWGDRVRPGGTMLVHDSFSSIGVTAAILVELVPGRRFRYVGRSRSLAVYRAAVGGPGRLSSAGRQLLQLPWFARNVGLKVLLSLGLGRLLARLGRPVPDWPY